MSTRGIRIGVWESGMASQGESAGATGIFEAGKNIPDQEKHILQATKLETMADQGPYGCLTWGGVEVVGPGRAEP